MNQITRDEAKFLAEHGIYCPRTCRLKRKGKSRGKYYCPDDRHVQELLATYRKSIRIIETYPND